MKISISIDVEQDLHSTNYNSLWKGIPLLLGLLNKHNIKATFFVPAKLLERFPEFFKSLENQGHEIALHGYKHERFDDLSFEEKEKRIKESIGIYKKIFNKNPDGFRAPQHSIDEKTLKILEQNNFLYDASYTPFNILQLLFFPKRFLFFIHGFFSYRKIKKINKEFYEVPTSSFIIPFVSIPLRVFPWILLKFYLNILRLTNKDLIFYAHSWDFIQLPKSKIDRYFSYRRLLRNLDKTIFYLNKKNKFLTINKLIKNENT